MIFGTSFVYLLFNFHSFHYMEPSFPPRKGVVSFKKYKCRTAADLGVDEQVLGYVNSYVNSKKQTRVNLSTNTLLDTMTMITLIKEDI